MSNGIKVKIAQEFGATQEIELPEGATVSTVMDANGVTIKAGYNVAVNGKRIDPQEAAETPVNDGDRVAVSREANGNS